MDGIKFKGFIFIILNAALFSTTTIDAIYKRKFEKLEYVPRDIPPDTRHIDLTGNNITTIPDDVFINLTSCEKINFQGNRINKIGLNAFRGLGNLTGLKLSSNNIRILPDNVFKYLIKCELLYLDKNQISNITNGTFKGLINLTKLFLHSNRIKMLPADVFSEVPKCVIIFIITR